MTTLTKTGLTIGLTTGALALGLGGVGFLASQFQDRASAGIVSTFPVASSASNGLTTTALAADPTATETLLDTEVATNQSGEPSKDAAPAPPPVPEAAGANVTPIRGPANAENANWMKAGNSIVWDFKPRSALVKRIEQSLRQDTEVVFDDSPLKETLNYLKDLHNIEIVLDQEALTADGISTEAPITFRMSGISLDSALNLMLEPLTLDYVIKHEVLFITTRLKAGEMMETRVYDISRLSHLPPEVLLSIMKNSVKPDSWEQVGGVGSVTAAPLSTLVIRQTQRIHREIVELLDQLVQVKAAPTKTPANLSRQPAEVKPASPTAILGGASESQFGSGGTPTVPAARPTAAPAKR